MNRATISDSELADAYTVLIEALQLRLHQKGRGSFASIHEVFGIIAEEYNELAEAVHSSNINDIRSELLDIAVPALFAVACIDSKKLGK